MPKKNKAPGRQFDPQVNGKVPRGGSLADQVPQLPFTWSVNDVDHEGPFGWERATLRDFFDEVAPKLKNFESMKWAEVDGPTGSHFVEYDSLCKEARDRLDALSKGDVEQLFSLRIAARKRVWGQRAGSTLELLWWDPEHAVCPSEKKNT